MSAPIPPAPPAATKRLPVLLRRAWYGLNQSFRQRIAHLGVTPDQFSILRWRKDWFSPYHARRSRTGRRFVAVGGAGGMGADIGARRMQSSRLRIQL